MDTSILALGKYSNGEAVNANIIILMVGMFILQLLFMVIGTAIAGISKNLKTAAAISTGILLMSFFVILLVLIIDVLPTVTFVFYNKRDLNI